MSDVTYLHAFDPFTYEEWYEWFLKALSGRFTLVRPARDETIHGTLIRVFKSIPLQQRDDFFSPVLAELIRTTPTLQTYAERLFYLLQVSQVAKPRAEKTIRKLLSDGIGAFTFMDGGQERRLQETLLGAAAKYGVDDWLREYIRSSARRTSEFYYAVFCMRLLSWRNDDSAFAFHDILIPLLTQRDQLPLYSSQLFLALKRLGCDLYFIWFHRDKHVLETLPRGSMELWKEGTRLALARNADNRHASLLLTELCAELKPVAGSDITKIADLKGSADRAAAEETLSALDWDLRLPQDPISRAFKCSHSVSTADSAAQVDPNSIAADVLDESYYRRLSDRGLERWPN